MAGVCVSAGTLALIKNQKHAHSRRGLVRRTHTHTANPFWAAAGPNVITQLHKTSTGRPGRTIATGAGDRGAWMAGTGGSRVRYEYSSANQLWIIVAITSAIGTNYLPYNRQHDCAPHASPQNSAPNNYALSSINARSGQKTPGLEVPTHNNARVSVVIYPFGVEGPVRISSLAHGQHYQCRRQHRQTGSWMTVGGRCASGDASV